MSYLVRPLPSGNFRVIEEMQIDNKRVVKTIPKTAWRELGFREEMTLKEAKARAKQINSQGSLNNKKVVNAARRVELLKTEASAFLPKDLVEQFEEELAEIYLDSNYRLEITRRYWSAAQLVILELAVDPKDFRENNQKFLNYFKKKLWSHDYIKRITRLLNMWGSFVARKRGSYFEPIQKLNSVQVQKIVALRDEASGIRVAAEPLTWNKLKNAEDKFKPEHYNWLVIATWFGLRPKEVDNLKKPKLTRIVEQEGIEILEVNQTKLTSIEKEKRWKPIPAWTPEQKEALEIVKSGKFERPKNKQLRALFGKGFQVASPRKAFTDLMLERGFQLEDISVFLGHQSIAMTWAKYKGRRKFNLPNVS